MDSPELIGGLRLAHNGNNRFPGIRVSAALRLNLRPLPGCLVCPIVPEQGGYGPDGGRIFRPGPPGSSAGVEAVHAEPFNGPGEFIPRRLKLCRLLRCQGINGLRAAGAWRHGSRKGKPLRPFPLRSNQYKCLSWPGGHRSRPARNAWSCCWTGRWSAYYPSVQSPAWAPPAPGKGEHVTADQHDLTTALSTESPSSEGLSRVPGFSERLPRDGRLPGHRSRPAAPGSKMTQSIARWMGLSRM